MSRILLEKNRQKYRVNGERLIKKIVIILLIEINSLLNNQLMGYVLLKKKLFQTQPNVYIYIYIYIYI